MAQAGLSLALVGLAACLPSDPVTVVAGDAAPTVCPRDLPGSCPTPPPSWGNEVQPIIESRCNGCHGEGGVERAVFDYSSYAGVYANRGPILNQVYACRMPPPDAAAPTADERRSLLAWLVCGAPND